MTKGLVVQHLLPLWSPWGACSSIDKLFTKSAPSSDGGSENPLKDPVTPPWAACTPRGREVSGTSPSVTQENLPDWELTQHRGHYLLWVPHLQTALQFRSQHLSGHKTWNGSKISKSATGILGSFPKIDNHKNWCKASPKAHTHLTVS